MFRQDSTCPALLEDRPHPLPVRGCHPLWPAFPDGSGSIRSATGLVRVRSPLLAESRLISFPPVTEMFQFTGFASHGYGLTMRYRRSGGFPHSEIPGSKPARGSPGLFAACYVLHRLSVPRHPPNALLALESIGFPCTGVNLRPRARAAETRNTQPPDRPRRARSCGRPKRRSGSRPLHDVKQRARSRCARRLAFPIHARAPQLVEVNGFEPMTSCLQSRRSPN
jgi:hypothetical protein